MEAPPVASTAENWAAWMAAPKAFRRAVWTVEQWAFQLAASMADKMVGQKAEYSVEQSDHYSAGRWAVPMVVLTDDH